MENLSSMDPRPSPATCDVLIIEDNLASSALIAMKLRRHNISYFTISELGSSSELPCLPQVIISDLYLPLMSGEEILIKLKRDPATSKIPFIVMTADSNLSTKLRLMSLGADDYLQKPFKMETLLTSIRKFLPEQPPVRPQEQPLP